MSPALRSVRNLSFLLGLVAYRLTLEHIFVSVIVETYAYQGFAVAASTGAMYPVSWALMLSIALILNSALRDESVASVILVLLFLLSAVPSFVYFSSTGASLRYSLLVWGYWLTLVTVFSFAKRIIVSRHIGRISFSRTVGKWVLIGLIASGLLAKLSVNGFYIHFDVLQVYGLRKEVADSGAVSPLMRYLLNWVVLGTAIAGVALLAKGRFLWCGVIWLVHIALFSVDGMKFYLLTLPTALTFFLAYRTGRLYLAPHALAALSILSYALLKLTQNDLLSFAFAYRTLFLPTRITAGFIDFFSHNAPDYLRQSVLGRLGFESQYHTPIPFLIDEYLSDGSGSANTGLLADAFSNFGTPGVILFPLAFVVYLRLLDHVTERTEVRLLSGLIVSLTISFLNTAFFTTMLTGGGLFALVYVFSQRGFVLAVQPEASSFQAKMPSEVSSSGVIQSEPEIR